jgi:phosphoglycolate phosphatase-like HAD superfamily hydrolase
MIKGIIFDLDGTLANTLPLCIAAFRKSVEPLAGRALSDEEIIATFGPSEEGTIRLLLPDHYEQGITSYLHYYASLHGMCPEPFPGIPELLNLLQEKGVRIGMVTGKGQHSTVISLGRFSLRPFFELVETGSSAGPVKAEGIAAILSRWKDLDKQQVLYVGDAPGDVVASRKAGVAVAGAAWAETAEPWKLQAAQPDEIFYRIEDFRAWILERV